MLVGYSGRDNRISKKKEVGRLSHEGTRVASDLARPRWVCVGATGASEWERSVFHYFVKSLLAFNTVTAFALLEFPTAPTQVVAQHAQ